MATGTMPAPISKRPGSTNAGGRRGFTAQFAGNCTTCGGPILPGGQLFYAPGNEAPSGLDCCGDRADTELIAYQLPGDDTPLDEELAVDATQVMPRGRTARDACGRCWQIPANNGSCGCDY